ncbi:MAG: hypothetical protein AAGB12_16750 [Pseudomonadota bacterium]
MAKIIGAIIFVAAGFLAYGDGVLFERIYIAVLVFMSVIFIKDINMVSVIAITTAANLCFMFLFPLLVGADYQILLKVATYCAMGVSLYRLKTEEYRGVIAFVLGLCIASELYWFAIGYPSPVIHWHVFVMMINVWMRHFLFQRVFIMAKYFPNRYRSLDLDLSLYELGWYYNIVHIVVIFEYFARHLFSYNITIVYYAAPYVFHGITTYSVFLILLQGYSIMRYQWFKA